MHSLTIHYGLIQAFYLKIFFKTRRFFVDTQQFNVQFAKIMVYIIILLCFCFARVLEKFEKNLSVCDATGPTKKNSATRVSMLSVPC